MKALNLQEMMLVNGGISTATRAFGDTNTDSLSYTIGKVVNFVLGNLAGLIPVVGPVIRNWLFSDFEPNKENSPKTGEALIAGAIDFAISFFRLH